MKKGIKIALCCAAALAVLGGGLALCVYHGVLLLNHPSRSRYPVRGVDVSHYQGEIDWPVLASQQIDFAFIKATEGSGYQDSRFATNWAGARASGLRAGAYHFFSFDSPGATQAENFCATVPKEADALPPVVDVEFYGDKAENPPARADVARELTAMLDALEAHYGQKPILYATEESYALFLAGDFADYDIWIRNVFTRPSLSDGRAWTFWQYTNRARLEGYEGEERFIDLNVFCGTREEFERYGAAA